MGRIDDIFARERGEGRRLVMPFLCGGFPAPGTLASLIGACREGGAAIVEVGLPFSDPIADGPVIAGAMHRALAAGSTAAGVMDEVREYRAQTRGPDVRDAMVREMLASPGGDVGLVAMVSASIVHRLGGLGRGGFAARARDAGFDGIIVPDLPLEESAGLREAAGDAGLSCALLVAPSTPPPRAAEIAKACTGFVYVLARAGVTGERGDVPDLGPVVRRLRESTSLPIAVGFGISTPEQARGVAAHADAVIVGSSLVRRIDEAHHGGRDGPGAAREFVASLVAAVR